MTGRAMPEQNITPPAQELRLKDPQQFYALVRPVFEHREIENSLFLGVARNLATRGGEAYLYALRRDNRVLAAALRTPPFYLCLCALEPAALADLAQALMDAGESVPGVVGPYPDATCFVERWCALAGSRANEEINMTLYALHAVVPPTISAPGALRPALTGDRDWLIEWIMAFGEEAGLPAHERERAYATATADYQIAQSRIFIWEDHARPVAIAGFTPTGITGARIGTVLTARAERRKGYGTAIVAALSQHLLSNGFNWCGLFADVTNPQSNRIFQRLGYREVCRFRSLGFTVAASP
jgi:predicted GNAT family acetyltransferase